VVIHTRDHVINKKSTVPTRDALHFQIPAVVEQPAYIVDFA
jgi:hypothetical protein